MSIVIEDIISHLKSKGQKNFKIYARKGDKVTIINQRDNVTIADNGKEAFPVKTELLK